MLCYIAQVQFYISQVYVLIMNKEMIQFPWPMYVNSKYYHLCYSLL